MEAMTSALTRYTHHNNHNHKINKNLGYRSECEIHFPTEGLALIAARVIALDEELSDKVEKFVRAENNQILRITFAAEEARLLRVSMSCFYDVLLVSLKGMHEFNMTN